jgi:type IV secretory pathway VirJ component
MASRLPADLRERVALVALLGPGREIDFEFHVTEWLLAPRGPDLLAVGPEVEKLRGIPVLCIHGESEADSLCPSLPSDLATSVARPGGHHFGGDYPALARRILEAVRRPIPARRG